ncbi:MAG TPA: RHS repeat-associated core domain-containing protein, partial [Pyrinomonadaceae bacterium]|nr:RHS repeat-associated core domain-containing protein [Pyrinomonadaceae bacterium]
LTYTGSNLTRITDAVGRSITLDYDGNGRITRATDPLNQFWRYTYEGTPGVAGGPGLTTVTNPLGHVTRYEYVTGGRLSAVTDARGSAVKRVFYDNNGRVTSETFADGGTERYDYTLAGGLVSAVAITNTAGQKRTMRFNAGGYVVGVTDELGQTSTIERNLGDNTASSTTGPCGCTEGTRQYDARGNVVSTTDRAGQTTKMEYDPVFNRLTKTTDALGRATSFGYDARGRLSSMTDALNQTTSYVYDSVGQITSVTDPLGRTRRIEYDAFGNVSALIDPLGHRVTIEHDAVGRVTAVTDPEGHRQTGAYDALGRMTSSTDTSGATTTYTYDANGNVQTITNALTQKWKRSYDGKNRLTSTTDPLGRVSRARYNANDRLTALVWASGRTKRFTYDALGRMATVTDPLGDKVTYKYDSTGGLVSVTDARGSVTTYQYDELKRLSGVRDPLGRATSFSYDAAGNVVEETDRLGRHIRYAYNALNQLAGITYPDAAVTYTYDAASRLSRIDDTQSGSIVRTYDEADRMLTEATPAGTVSFGYNGVGQITSLAAAGRPAVAYVYDAAGRIQNITQGAESFTYGYDAVSRPLSMQRPNGVRTEYGYDTAGRLQRLSHTNGLGQLLEDYRYTYSQDDEISSIASLVPPVLPAPKNVGAADAANRIASFGDASYTFDAAGRTTSKSDAAGTTSYGWDSRGRLTQATLPTGQSVNYSYDALGRLSGRSEGGATTDFLYAGTDVILDRRSDGAQVDYLNGPGLDNKLRQSGGSSGALYFLQDHLGSTTALTDGAGNVAERTQFEPFGESTGSSLTRYGFTGRERDSSTGLLNFRARWYDPQQGRFLSEDPIGFSGGSNFYAYAGDNPISFVDPLGLSFSTFMSGFARGFVVGGITGFLVAAAIAATGGVAGAIIAALALGYGAYQFIQAIDELMNGNLCPDERDEKIGELIGAMIGAALGGGLGARAGSGLRGGSGNGGGGAGCAECGEGAGRGGQCFAAGTKVSTPDGDKDIQDVKEGDAVYAFDFESGQVIERKVQKVFRNFTFDWVQVSINGEVIKATKSHPFWVEREQRWVKASELQPGMRVRLRDGRTSRVESVKNLSLIIPEATYNFAVAGVHNYFVGQDGVLVHNQTGSGSGGSAPGYVVSPGGTVFPVPPGATGPVPVINPAGNQTGVAFTGGSGGANGQVDTIRLMDPTPPRGASPGYPDGYIKYTNSGKQPVDPYTGKTIPNSQAHFPCN